MNNALDEDPSDIADAESAPDDTESAVDDVVEGVADHVAALVHPSAGSGALDGEREIPEILRGRLEKPLSPSTKRAYFNAWAAWATWCRDVSRRDFPASELDIAEFLALRGAQECALATLELTYQAIRAAHRMKGEPLPTFVKVRNVLESIRRERARAGGVPEGRGVRPLPFQWLVELAPATSLRGLRDRALLLTGFGIALRRSELVALRRWDLEFNTKGVAVTIRQSKTDQLGKTWRLPLFRDGSPSCPVAALRAWLQETRHLGDESAPIFLRMTDRETIETEEGIQPLADGTVAGVVKALARRNDADPELYAGHSLRSGFVTEMRSRKNPDGSRAVPDEVIMAITRHKSFASYVRYDKNDDPMRYENVRLQRII